MTAGFLAALLAANMVASIAILVVMAVRLPLRRLSGARLAYWLWAVPVVAGLATLLPAAPAHISPLPAAPFQPMATAALEAIDWRADAIAPVEPTSPAASLDATMLVFALWAAGALVSLAIVLIRQQRALSALGRISRANGGLRAANASAGPAVIGVIRPRLVIPTDFEERFDVRERELILAHERTHLRAGDTRVNAGLALLTCINWFNPLVHIAARLVRADQELACDAAVVERFPGDRRVYAEALLKTQLAPASLPLGCTWPPRSTNLLKERVTMLASDIPTNRRQATGAALVACAAVVAALVGCAQPPDASDVQLAQQNAGIEPAMPMTAPLNPRTMTDAHAWNLLQQLRKPDGAPAGVKPSDIAMLRAQLEARFGGRDFVPVASAPPETLNRDAFIEAVQTQPIPARIANAVFTCDVWTGKYNNSRSFNWNDFNDEASLVLSIDGAGHPNVILPDNAFPSGAFPAHGAPRATRFIDTTSISYRLMSDTLIDSLTFIDLDRPIAKVKWQRISLGDNGPTDTFLDGYCRR